MENEQNNSYVLIESGQLETLMRNTYLLSKSLFAFEYLCSHSDRPMYLTAKGVCEVLEITEPELDECRIKRLIRVKVIQKQMMYSIYDLVMLSEKLRRRRMQRQLSRIPKYLVSPQQE